MNRIYSFNHVGALGDCPSVKEIDRCSGLSASVRGVHLRKDVVVFKGSLILVMIVSELCRLS